MSSAADTLRRAAEVLRERAEAATPGPWSVVPESCAGGTLVEASGVAVVGEWGARHVNAAYIATVDPTVGVALADWLERFTISTAEDPETAALFSGEVEDALAVARAILTEARDKRGGSA